MIFNVSSLSKIRLIKLLLSLYKNIEKVLTSNSKFYVAYFTSLFKIFSINKLPLLLTCINSFLFERHVYHLEYHSSMLLRLQWLHFANRNPWFEPFMHNNLSIIWEKQCDEIAKNGTLCWTKMALQWPWLFRRFSY